MLAHLKILMADQLARLSNATMKPVASSYLVAVLKSRKLLTGSEAHYLTRGLKLSKLYESRHVCDCEEDPHAVDQSAAAAAKHAIQAGDLAEAVLQASRCLPELKDLQYLAERRGLITHGA